MKGASLNEDAATLQSINEVRWLAFKSFGIPSRLFARDLPPGGDGWPVPGIWFCGNLHQGSPRPALQTVRPPLFHKCMRITGSLVRKASRRPKAGRCASGLRILALPLISHRINIGTLLLGPFAPSPITPEYSRMVAVANDYPDLAHLEWAARQVPVIGPEKERKLLEWLEKTLSPLLDGNPPGSGKEGEADTPYSGPAVSHGDIPASVFSVFSWLYNGKPVVRPLFHREMSWELIHVGSGKATVKLGRRTIHLGPDDAVLVPPGQPLACPDFADDAASGSQFDIFGQMEAFRIISKKRLSLSRHQGDLLTHLASSFYMGSGTAFRDPRLNVTILQLLMDFANIGKTDVGFRISRARMRRKAIVARAREYLENRIERRVPLTELASACSSRVFSLLHAFRREEGVSPMRWHSRIRMNAARRMLREEGASVSAVAAHLGYSDIPQFSRAFRKSTGIYPSEYVKSG